MGRFLIEPFPLFALAGLLGSLAIAGGSLYASDRAGEAEAMADVRALTELVAKTVVEPSLSAELMAGDEAAVAELDRIIRTRVLDETTVRVKLWDADGRVVYSDVPELVGEFYELGEDKSASLHTGTVVSEISSLEGPENRFERDRGQLLEVYLPIDGPDGTMLLYESYFALSGVSESSGRIRSAFFPIVVAALALMEAMHLGLAWGLSRRSQRSQRERERLLQRAIDSSDLERRRIAADVHDGVLQDLVGASLAVSAAAETAAAYEPELASDLRAAAVGTRRSLQSLRSLLVEIYPPKLQEQGLEAALVDLLAPATGLGVEIELTLVGDVDRSVEATAMVYRVLQESIRNVFNHAGATLVRVYVEAADELIKAEVRDDGVGFDPSTPPREGHLGLRLLADLATDTGSRFSIESAPGLGTLVLIEVNT